MKSYKERVSHKIIRWNIRTCTIKLIGDVLQRACDATYILKFAFHLKYSGFLGKTYLI